MLVLLCLEVLLLCLGRLQVGKLSGLGHHALLLIELLLSSKERRVGGEGKRCSEKQIVDGNVEEIGEFVSLLRVHCLESRNRAGMRGA